MLQLGLAANPNIWAKLHVCEECHNVDGRPRVLPSSTESPKLGYRLEATLKLPSHQQTRNNVGGRARASFADGHATNQAANLSHYYIMSVAC